MTETIEPADGDSPGGWDVVRRKLASLPWWVVVATFGAAFLIGAPASISAGYEFAGVLGLIATLWATFLAVTIYFLTSGDSRSLLEEIRELREQLDSFAPDPGSRQSPTELAHNLVKYADYVDALVSKYPMPREAIVFVDRPLGKRGNRPVAFETQRGRRYSVWKGAMPGYYSVQRLDNR
jgi:hypothetical protein